MTARDRTGHSAAFLNCGGIGMPPFAVKYRGRWYVTEWISANSFGQTVERPEVLGWVRSLGVLRFGTRRFLDYLERTDKRWTDCPRAAVVFDSREATQ